MLLPNSSSVANTTTVAATAAVVAAVAVLATVALEKIIKNHDDEIILQTVIGKCQKCLKINLVYFVSAHFYPIKTMGQPPCFDIEY